MLYLPPLVQYGITSWLSRQGFVLCKQKFAEANTAKFEFTIYGVRTSARSQRVYLNFEFR